MKKRFLPAALLLMMPAFAGNAITYTYGEFKKSAKTCTLMSWGGQQPTSGKLVLKETFEQDGVTYKVTAIASHALDNLTEVTEITIPANVKTIGETTGIYVASCRNFNNCPKLKTFKVASGSETFAATGAGILMKKGGTIMVRVPEALAVTNGTLNMSTSTRDICPDAFAGNTTITKLGLSTELYPLLSNCGFNDMKMLREFALNGTEAESILIRDGILYNKDSSAKTLVSFPPARTDAGYSIPGDVKKVGARAFANTTNLKSIQFGTYVEELGEEAFRNSGLVTLELPNRRMELGRGVFSHNQSLTEISIPHTTDLPRDFARNSYHLRKVFVNSSATTYGDCAFKYCVSLDNFNFRPDMTFEGDSIFADCGFRQIEFSAGAVGTEGINLGTAMFDGNTGLEKADLSGLVMNDGNGSLSIGTVCFSNCPALREVYLPRYTSFWSSSVNGFPNFGTNPAIRTLVIGAFNVGMSGQPVMYYNQGATVTPTIFVKATDAPVKSWPMKDLVITAAGSNIKPLLFCEAYTMENGDWGDKYEYVLPGAIYYVPGATEANYSGAVQSGCTVNEMYGISYSYDGGTFRVDAQSNIGDGEGGIEFVMLTVNDEWSCEADASGHFVTPYLPGEVESYTLEYDCRGIRLKTRYPKPASVGVAEIEAESVKIDGDTAWFGGATADFEVFDMAGNRVMRGRGDKIRMSDMAQGVYIISVEFDNGKKVVNKIRL